MCRRHIIDGSKDTTTPSLSQYRKHLHLQHLPQISSKKWFILSKMWFVIMQLSQNIPRHRCLSNFSSTFLNIRGYNTFVFLIISLESIQSATRVMRQKELIIQNTKLLLKMTISNLKKAWTNTALFEFGLAKSDIRQLSWPNVKLTHHFPTISDFTFPFVEAFHKMSKL